MDPTKTQGGTGGKLGTEQVNELKGDLTGLKEFTDLITNRPIHVESISPKTGLYGTLCFLKSLTLAVF